MSANNESRLEIKTFVTPYLNSNMYLLLDGASGIIVDPCDEESILRCMDEIRFDWAFVTHEHYDHISGVNAIKERFGCPVISSALCGERLPNATKNFSRYFVAFCYLLEVVPENIPEVKPYTCTADRTFSGQLPLRWAGHDCLLVEMPGHLDSCAGLLVDGQYLFAGDALLYDLKGKPKLPPNRFKKSFKEKTLSFLSALPTETTVYPGHEAPFALSEYLEALSSLL